MLSTSLSSRGTRPDNSSRCYGESTPPKSVDGTTNHFKGTAYDEAGNVTTEGLRTFTYDALGVTTGVNSIARRFRFLYTADDERLAAVELLPAGNRTTWTLRGLDNQLLRTWSDASSTGTSVAWKEDVIRRGSLLLASETSSGTRHYILDHLGSPRLVSDATGNHTQSFSPFGGGGTSDGGALQFTGHERDNAEFGDGTADLPDYMHARFYDSGAGRFLSVDPTVEIERAVHQPQGWNRYVYVMNNPLRLTDPTGRYVCRGTEGNCNAIDLGIEALRASAAALKKADPRKAGLQKVVDAYGQKGNANSKISIVWANPTKPDGSRLIPKGDANGMILGVAGKQGNLFVSLENVGTKAGGNFDNSVIILAGTLAHEGKHELQPAVVGFEGKPSLLSLVFYEHEAYMLEEAFYEGAGAGSMAPQPGPGAWNSATTACSEIGCTP